MNALSFMYVAIGGAFGAMCRYLVYVLATRAGIGGQFPAATFAVNIAGSFLLGLFIAVIAFTMPTRGRDLHLLIAVGALGGFTTFSAFAMDSYLLLERGLVAQGVFYIAGSVVFSVLALFSGMWIGRSLLG